MKRKAIVFASIASAAMLGVIGGCVLGNVTNFISKAENPTASECGLVFTKDSHIYDPGGNQKDNYIQESTLRLSIKGVHIDKTSKELTLYKPSQGHKNYIYTNGTAYDAAQGFGSVANGLESIDIVSDVDCKVYVSYLTCDPEVDDNWLYVGNKFEIKTNQYPPRYFKIEPVEKTTITSITIGCSTKTSLLSPEAYFTKDVNIPKTVNISYTNITASQEFDFIIDRVNETITYLEYNIDSQTFTPIVLKPISYNSTSGLYECLNVGETNFADPHPVVYQASLDFANDSYFVNTGYTYQDNYFYSCLG